MNSTDRQISVVGHKNPDTDSVCAAIAYSRLKNKVTGSSRYVPRRAGHLNEETRFVLERFEVKRPQLLLDVRTQVSDMEIRRTDRVQKDISLKKAWEYMRDNDIVTLPVVEEDRLLGIIAMSDIVKSYMDILDSRIMTTAKTSYKNILETLEGRMEVGDIEGTTEKGKVLVAAGSPEMMESFIEPNDVIILGNRYETQLCAIEMEASCLVVCGGAPIAKTIKKLAGEHGCRIICTDLDTFTVSRLINQSMPISHFMRSNNLLLFRLDDYIEDVQKVMARERHRYFPILDKNDHFVGMISRRNLLGANKKQLILVDHNEEGQAVNGADSADILEIIDHHRLGAIQTTGPVYFRNQPLGSTCTIIYLMYLENGVEIDPQTAGILCSAILSDTLLFRSPTCTEVDKNAGEALAKIAGIDPQEFAKEMFRAGSSLSGKSPKAIIYQDFKRFFISDHSVGIGQVSAVGHEELSEIGAQVKGVMGEILRETNLEMLFFMLTDIFEESSRVLVVGSDADKIMERAFGVRQDEEGYFSLSGVVSRKKQFLPLITDALQMGL